MAKQEDTSEGHLDWLVNSRSKTQAASLKLFKIITEHQEKLKEANHYATAQELVAVAFSLWRAVFLADKSGEKGSSLRDAKKFLATLLIDNAINYSQDRAAREWTFSYYATNALRHLEMLQKKFPNINTKVPPSPRARWDHLENAFEDVLNKFSKTLEKI